MAMDPDKVINKIYDKVKTTIEDTNKVMNGTDDKLRTLISAIVNEIIAHIKSNMEITINSPEVKVTIPPATVTQGAGASSVMNPAPIILTDVKGTINQNGGDIS